MTLENKYTITLVLDSEKEKAELKDKIEKCLETLYLLENFTNYEQSKIGECINLLQKIKIINQKERKMIYE